MTATPWGTTHAMVGGAPEAADLVMVPGLAVSVYLRASVSALAAAGYRAWLVDPPGFGESGAAVRRLGVPGIASAVEHWLRERGLRRVVLAGHSSGTQVAAHVAARAPDLVERLVLASPTLDPHYRSWFKAVPRWQQDGRREPKSLVRTQLPEWRRAGALSLLTLVRSVLNDDIENTLRRVTCPVLVIRGERDPLCTPEWVRQLARGHDLVELPGLPHAFPYQAPTAFADALGSWK
jgi:pimeloyl-ACP methyl ester carboxylesterase